MSYLQQVEQATPSAAPATNQYIYPKVGSMARMDSSGTEKLLLDTSTYAAALSASEMQVNFWGI